MGERWCDPGQDSAPREWDRLSRRAPCRDCGERPRIDRGASGRRILLHRCPVTGRNWALEAPPTESGTRRTVLRWNARQRMPLEVSGNPHPADSERERPTACPTGPPEVTTEMVTSEPEGQTGYHTQQVPSRVYVLDGELELRIDGQEPQRFTSGQVFVEAQDIPMQAFNVAEGPTRLLVVSIGAEGEPTGQPAMPASE